MSWRQYECESKAKQALASIVLYRQYYTLLLLSGKFNTQTCLNSASLSRFPQRLTTKVTIDKLHTIAKKKATRTTQQVSLSRKNCQWRLWCRRDTCVIVPSASVNKGDVGSLLSFIHCVINMQKHSSTKMPVQKGIRVAVMRCDTSCHSISGYVRIT